MRLYSLGEVCALFSIDPVTLRRWMRRATISPHVDPSDHRRRYLDQAQLLRLSQLHQRVLLAPPHDASSSVPLAQLRQEIADLVRRIERLEARSCRCCSLSDAPAQLSNKACSPFE
jgi:transposase-like protein